MFLALYFAVNRAKVYKKHLLKAGLQTIVKYSFSIITSGLHVPFSLDELRFPPASGALLNEIPFPCPESPSHFCPPSLQTPFQLSPTK